MFRWRNCLPISSMVDGQALFGRAMRQLQEIHYSVMIEVRADGGASRAYLVAEPSTDQLSSEWQDEIRTRGYPQAKEEVLANGNRFPTIGWLLPRKSATSVDGRVQLVVRTTDPSVCALYLTPGALVKPLITAVLGRCGVLQGDPDPHYSRTERYKRTLSHPKRMLCDWQRPCRSIEYDLQSFHV